MWREESVEELSDGRLYTANDLVKIGTDDCRDCADCCRMGPVIVLDPLDVFELNRFLGQSFEELLNDTIELKVRKTGEVSTCAAQDVVSTVQNLLADL